MELATTLSFLKQNAKRAGEVLELHVPKVTYYDGETVQGYITCSRKKLMKKKIRAIDVVFCVSESIQQEFYAKKSITD